MNQPDNLRNAPCPFEVTAGEEYWWCACGRTQREPLCDGSHKGSGVGPVVITAEKSGTVSFCGCKKTGNPPYCDGSHAKALG